MNEGQKKMGKVEDWIERDIIDKGERRRRPGIEVKCYYSRQMKAL
jgi:hypothetical protein